MSYNHILLVSQSPRRSQILSALGLPFQTAENAFEEKLQQGVGAYQQVKRLSRQKMEHFLSHQGSPQVPVLTADTLIGLGKMVLGKPQSEGEAWSFLRQLAGKTHQVCTGFSLYVPHENRILTQADRTLVTFVPWDEALYRHYWSQGEWHDAAGAYKIQAAGSALVQKISGSWTNVVGLPSHRIYGILRQHQCLPSPAANLRDPQGNREI